MERRVRVNYSDEQSARDALIGIIGDGAAGASVGEALELARTDGGRCLYLGPAGQRCDRAALASGFCRKHSSGRTDEAPGSSRAMKRAAAVIGALAVLWPVIADLVRELLRLLK
jgi:hypothetical protein